MVSDILDHPVHVVINCIFYGSSCSTFEKQDIRGLGFKFVDFLYKSSDVCNTEIKMVSYENTVFYLLYKILSIVLLIIVSAQQ